MGRIINLTSDNHIEYDDLLNKIATFLFVETSGNTSTNNRTTHFDDIESCFDLEHGFIDEEMANDIIDRLYENFGKMIADHDIYYEKGGYDEEKGYYVECDRYFDITLYEDFCVGYVEDDQSIIENRKEGN